jgi:hypothetical protein
VPGSTQRCVERDISKHRTQTVLPGTSAYCAL